jgi:phosphatidylglycerophosphate synthase
MIETLSKSVGRVFSDKYVNHAAVVDNYLLLLMYRFAYPFAAGLNRLHLSPNVITALSLLFSLFSFLALSFDKGWILFTTFWGLTVLLDFCDGTVARMANKVSKSAFRFDHMSDLIKISLVIMGVAIRYNDLLIWMLAFAASFLFMYSDALNRELNFATKLQKPVVGGDAPAAAVRLRNRYRIIAWAVRYEHLLKGYKNLQTILLTINGHTLLLFFIFPFGPEISILGFVYLIFIELWAVKSRLLPLIAMRRP